MTISDPVPPPEGSVGLRAKDLKNRVLLLRPLEVGEDVGKDGKPWTFVECDVWVLDRSGVEQHAEGVRFSWWRAVEQLRQQLGQLVACKPVEQDDNSVALVPLGPQARQVAEQVAASLRAPQPAPHSAPQPAPAASDPFGEEPF